jgi:hypothetical protein
MKQFFHVLWYRVKSLWSKRARVQLRGYLKALDEALGQTRDSRRQLRTKRIKQSRMFPSLHQRVTAIHP